jgi:hypothetical protein
MAYAGTSYGLRSLINLDLKTNHEFWVVIGQTDDWTSEPTPDAFAPGDTSIADPVVAIKPAVLSLCREVSEADYNLLLEGQRASVVIEGVSHYFAFVADEDYLTEYARFLYMHAIYSTPLGMPSPSSGDFRQYSVYLDLTPAAGYESADWLEPANVDDYGILAYSNKREAIAVNSGGPIVIVPVLIELR